MTLVPLILALCIIPSWYQFGHILPICGREVFGLVSSFYTVGMYGPVQELCFFVVPISFRRVLSNKYKVNETFTLF